MGGPGESGEEGIVIDVEKQISEKFGEDAGQQAGKMAEAFMKKLTQHLSIISKFLSIGLLLLH